MKYSELTNNTVSGYPESCSKEILQNVLTSLDPEENNNLNDSIWRINGLPINFTPIIALSKSYPEWVKNIPIDLTIFSKIMLLNNSPKFGGARIRYSFDSIVKILYYLAENNAQVIEQKDYEKFLSYFLINRIEKNNISKLLTPINYHLFKGALSSKHWVNTLKYYQLPQIGYSSIFSESFISKSIKNTIAEISDGDIGFADWVNGGSFNRLTLDHGRYYVDFCSDFFDEHIGLATALRRTLSQATRISIEAGLNINERNIRSYVKPVIVHFLSGKRIDELPEKTLKIRTPQWLESIYIATNKVFNDNLKKQKILEHLLSDINLKNLGKKFSRDLKHENNEDWVKQIISIRWAYLISEVDAVSINLRKMELDCFGDLISLERIKLLNVAIDKLFYKLNESLSLELPTKEFYSTLGIVENKTFKNATSLIKMVEAAGATTFVAFTGWRESEFGFGVGNIKCFKNFDILDQLANPIRYEVSWKVPKTNGGTHLSREITYKAYCTALRLSELVECSPTQPCLYSLNANMHNPNFSSEVIPRLVSSLWANFVVNYPPFKNLDLIDELNLLNSKLKLKEFEISRLKFLKQKYIDENWDYLENDFNLIEAKNRSKNEFERVNFLIDQYARSGFIWKYKNGRLEQNHTLILNDYLSEDTKNTIMGFQSEDDISPIFSRGVINEIIQNCLYPTPHAFRHMWAEAVYRRFDGDAGWMIRSNFKHISPSMWIAYIRDKDNRRQHERTKRHVISSLMSNYIKKNGQGYAGPLDKFLRRLFNVTHVTKPEELISLVEEFASNEIENIKSNSWGYCLLMTRNKARAKCSEEGTPQRHKASPSLCLGCLNNLTQTGNIEGIILGISNDLKVLKQVNMPAIFFNESFKTVFNAYNHLKKLNADSETLSEIYKILNPGMEAKLL